MTKNRLIFIILICVVAMGVVGFFRYQQLETQKEMIASVSDEGELSSLIGERNDLKTDLKDITKEFVGKNMGPLVVLFAEPSKRLVPKGVRALTRYGYKGMIAVSSKHYPGSKSCISKEDVKKCVSKGWEIAIDAGVDTDDLAALARKVKSDFGKVGAVYLPSTNIEVDSAALAAAGTNTVIRYGAGAGYGPEKGEKKYSSDFIALGCNENNRAAIRDDVMTSGNCFVYVLGVKNAREYCDNIEKWSKSLNKTAEEEKFQVTTISKAKGMVASNKKAMAERKKDYNGEISRLKAEIKKLNRKIEKVEKEYEKKESPDDNESGEEKL